MYPSVQQSTEEGCNWRNVTLRIIWGSLEFNIKSEKSLIKNVNGCYTILDDGELYENLSVHPVLVKIGQEQTLPLKTCMHFFAHLKCKSLNIYQDKKSVSNRSYKEN